MATHVLLAFSNMRPAPLLCCCAAVLAGMLGVADGQVQASAAACLAALAIEVDSKVPVVAAAAPTLIKLAQGGEPVRVWPRHSLCGA